MKGKLHDLSLRSQPTTAKLSAIMQLSWFPCDVEGACIYAQTVALRAIKTYRNVDLGRKFGQSVSAV